MSCPAPTTYSIENCNDCLMDSDCGPCGVSCFSDPAVSTATFNLIEEHYKEPFNKILNYLVEKGKVDVLDRDDINFHNMRNVDASALADHLFNLMKISFNLVTSDLAARESTNRGGQGELALIREQIAQNRMIINDIKNLNSTAKREIEINLNKSRKFANTNRVLMIVLVLVGILIIFPILKAAKVIDLKTGIIGWCVVLVAVLGYMFYELYIKETKRDNVDYKRYNFAKPSDEEIAKSRALAQMSDKDKSRCQAFAELEEELEVPNVNLDISGYISANTNTNTIARCDSL